jgi:hypothetical protein
MVASSPHMESDEGGGGRDLAAVNGDGDRRGRRGRRGRRDRRVGLLLALVCFLVYNANLRLMDAGDTYPARCLPFALLGHGALVLDSVRDLVTQGRVHLFWLLHNRPHLVSSYPVVAPVLLAPLYVPAVLYLQARGWQAPSLDRAARIMEKVTASLVAAVTMGLFYLLARRRAEPRAALLVSLAIGFGTTTWVISSQALWQHGFAQLLLVCSLLLLTGPCPCTPWRAAGVGALCVLLAGNRPPDIILSAALGLYSLRWAGRRAPFVAAGALLPLALLVAYNVEVVGNLGGSYFVIDYHTIFGHGHSMWAGAAGLLFSPARGLLVFSPFFFFLAWRPGIALGLSVPTPDGSRGGVGGERETRGGGGERGASGEDVERGRGGEDGERGRRGEDGEWERRGEDGEWERRGEDGEWERRGEDVERGRRGELELTVCLVAGMAVLILLYGIADWRAGASWGPRWLTDIVPVLGWMLAPVVASLGRAGRAVFAVTAAVGIAIEVVGAFWYTGASETAIYSHAAGSFEMSGAWQPANAPFLTELQHSRPPGDLAVDVRGTIDRVSGDALGRRAVTRGKPLVAEGWAAADGRPPGAVMVSVDDVLLGATAVFSLRADVRAMLHGDGRTGWMISVPTGSLRPGPHLLQATARAGDEGSRTVPLAQRRFMVLPRRMPLALSWEVPGLRFRLGPLARYLDRQ